MHGGLHAPMRRTAQTDEKQFHMRMLKLPVELDTELRRLAYRRSLDEDRRVPVQEVATQILEAGVRKAKEAQGD